ALNQLPAIKSLTPQAIKQLHEAKGIMLEQDNLWTEAGFSSLISNEKRLISLLQDTPFSSIYFPGAITSNIYKHLGSSLQPYKLYFRHPECLKLPVNELKAFVEHHHPQCLIPYNIKAVAINSEAIGAPSIDADEFRNRLRKTFPQLSLFDTMETA
ncbi:MAG: hypothetical protein PHO32_06150, partial [Candidatus Cloacimonetes bacterium]|nr:hypothetical protein [Candidatus Cloacimonadota bacterium]